MALTRINNNSLSAVTAAGIPKGTGEILQVVHQKMAVGDVISTSSTSYVDLGLEASITPRSTSNKIMVTFNCQFWCPGASDYAVIGLARNGSTIDTPNSNDSWFIFGVESGYNRETMSQYLDSPNSTASQTYKILIRSLSGNEVRAADRSNWGVPSLTLTEIAG